MDIFQAIILGIIEGFTEFLPISSTGHMILAADLMGIANSNFLKSFEIIIQLGAVLAVFLVYLKFLLNNPKVWIKLAVAFLPTAIVGLVFYEYIKMYLLGNTAVVLWALFTGGVVLIVWEKLINKQDSAGVKGQGGVDKSIEELRFRRAFIIGVFQSLAVVPGVSRSAATIIGGVSVGLSRRAAVEFSFLLALPTMFAATGLDLVKSSFSFSSSEWGILAVGFAGAFVTAIVAVKFFLNFVEKHTFVPFGVYRILLALVFWFFVM
jgi:undecaprenyl-diphosphatase